MSDFMSHLIGENYEPGIICQGCGKVSDKTYADKNWHDWKRHDAYGIFTGYYCDECYNSDKYPYRKDRYYDPSYCGERMEEDY